MTSRRFRAFVLAQVVAVGVLVGFWIATLRFEWGYTVFDPARSGPGAIWTARVLRVALLVAPLAALAGPRALGVLQGSDSRRSLLDPWLVGLVVVGILVAAVHLVVPLVFVMFLWPLAIGAALLLLGGLRWFASDRWRPTHEEVFRGVALLGLLVTVTVVGGVVGAQPHPDLTVEAGMAPVASFESSYEAVDADRGRLTITHDGGDALRRDRLSLVGTGFANVSDVDQTEAGPWRGDASGSVGEAHAVTYEDAVTVGVDSDCSVSVTYTGRTNNTVALSEAYGCGES